MSINPSTVKLNRSIIDQDNTQPHQIIPIKYQWARNHYQAGLANTWMPEEISMHLDIQQWKSNTILTDQERHIIIWCLGFFSTAESLTANNIVLSVYKYVTNPECRQYMLRQAFEEAIHTDTFIYCCDSLGLDPNKIYSAYQDVPSIKNKDDFVVSLTQSILDPNFQIKTPEDIKKFVLNLVGFYVIMEGIFFYAGFALMLSIRKDNKMVGIGQQFEYIMRDESLHLAFGCDLINTIMQEHPEIFDISFKDTIKKLILTSVTLEEAYLKDAFIPGNIQPHLFIQYTKYIADRRLERLYLETHFNVQNPFPWMSTATDLSKEKNFFETKVTEYQTGSALEW